MLILSVVIFVFALLGTSKSAERSLPSFIDRCKENDPDLNKCIMINGNKAIPLLRDGDVKHKIPAFDPLQVNKATIEPGGNLKLDVKDIKIYGLSDGKITDVNATLQDGDLSIKMFVPKSNIVGDYTMTGKLLFLPITGNGPLNITFTNLNIYCKLNYKKEKINNIEQMVVQKVDVDYDVEYVYFKYGNLFNGDPVLEPQMTKFIEENWREVEKEFHKDNTKIVSKITENIFITIVKDVPFNQIFLD